MPEKLTPELQAHRCSYETDEQGLAHWTEAHADAWIGLLETHKQLTRALDAELTARVGGVDGPGAGGGDRCCAHVCLPKWSRIAC